MKPILTALCLLLASCVSPAKKWNRAHPVGSGVQVYRGHYGSLSPEGFDTITHPAILDKQAHLIYTRVYGVDGPMWIIEAGVCVDKWPAYIDQP